VLILGAMLVLRIALQSKGEWGRMSEVYITRRMQAKALRHSMSGSNHVMRKFTSCRNIKYSVTGSLELFLHRDQVCAPTNGVWRK
jgi:hypothetical protein